VASLILVTGPPGSGKSTVAALLARRFEPSVLVDGDAFYGFIARGAVPPWQPDATHQNEVCTAAAGAACGRYAAGGFTVVFDGMVGPWFLPQFLAATGLDELAYVVLLPPEDVVVDRVETRVGHGFADISATRHMHGEFSRSRVADRHVIDNVGDQDETVQTILDRLAAGALLHPGPR
jgi:ribose 1,5-bisphosphokinase PhnN